MVLYKRKPVQYEAPGDKPEEVIFDPENVWAIEETGEVYKEYEAFLKRMYFYRQKKFTCSITGQSGLDFFSAQQSEQEASHDVEDAFPDALRLPILRKVQHSTISRIDNLVDHVYDAFRQDYYPGESVNVSVPSSDNPDGERAEGLVREKVHMREQLNKDGEVKRPEMTRYMVSLLGSHNNRDVHVDSLNVYRDRKAFTKQMLRPFLKNSLLREAWSGAPWMVKPELAAQYSINQEIPRELTYDYQVAQRKAAQEAKKVKPPPSQDQQQRIRAAQFLEYKRAINRDPSIRPDPHPPQSPSDPLFIKFMNQHPNFTAKSIERVPPPAPIKYPREDLENDMRRLTRPSLKFLGAESQTSNDSSAMEGVVSFINQGTVGRLLETWNTLNVYCEVFHLDSFTFDDYVEALQFTQDQGPNELVIEMHCAILKKLVNSNTDQNGHVQINLPAAIDDDDESEEEERTPTPEPEVKTRTTRRSLKKAEAAEITAQAAIAAKPHNGAEIDQCVKNYDWKTRARKRDFADGKWIVILVGLLNVFTRSSRHKDLAEEVLKVLAPTDAPATEATAIDQYFSAIIDTRAMIVSFLCELSVETKAMREYMDNCSTDMTDYRKTKIEWQRQKKVYVAELTKLDDERRTLQPEMAADPGLDELNKQVEEEVNEDEEQQEEEDDAEDSEDSNPIPTRSLRRGNDRAAERRKRIEEEKQKKAKADAEKAKKPSKEEKRLEKIAREIDNLHAEIKHCEDEVADCDNDLREADCQRSRVLGIDRFWNRYYWFERNGMPFGGLPDSSTAEAGYANGCLWVQGPDTIEREGFLLMNEADNARYKAHFQVTVPERKIKEEGDTHVDTAQQWGYYDDPVDLDNLISWLDIKGLRENKLRKQLQVFHAHIEEGMIKRQAYLNPPKDESREASEEPVKRASTRKSAATVELPPLRRSDKWHNTMAVNEEGHLHSEEPIRGTKRGAAKLVSNRTKPAPAAKEEPEPRQTRGSAKPKAKTNKGYGLR